MYLWSDHKSIEEHSFTSPILGLYAEIRLGPDDADERDEEDRHLDGSTTDNAPPKALGGHQIVPRGGPIPCRRLITCGGIYCIGGGFCNAVRSGAGWWDVQERMVGM